MTALSRRAFLGSAGAGTFVLAARRTAAAGGKALAGVFPIVQTPFTNADKLDLETPARSNSSMRPAATVSYGRSSRASTSS